MQVILEGNDFNITKELFRLDALAQDYTKLSNSTYFKYGIIDDDNANTFCIAYCTLIDDLVKEDIKELTILLNRFKQEKMLKTDYEEALLSISTRVTKNRQDFFDEYVYPAAKQYYLSESLKIKKKEM